MGLSYGELAELENIFYGQCEEKGIRWTDEEVCAEALFQFIADYEEDGFADVLLCGYGYEVC